MATITVYRDGACSGDFCCDRIVSLDYADFGAFVEEEKKFSGYKIPSRLPVGWHVGTDRFESEGEFFRVTIDDAAFR